MQVDEKADTKEKRHEEDEKEGRKPSPWMRQLAKKQLNGKSA